MAWVFAVLLVAVIGGIALVATGRGEGMAPADNDDPDPGIPDGVIGPDDLRRVRFNVTLRGYRAAEVDRLLDRLAEQLEK
jgi:DivIVA domain-containing protein